MKKTVLSILVTLWAAVSYAQPGPAVTASNYTNPVSRFSLPDPTVIDGGDGYFYLYATQDIGLVPIMRSDNLVDWRHVGDAFTRQTRPAFIDGRGDLWAPDINRIGDKFVLYYSLSLWGEVRKNGIGAATADTPKGPFTDRGALFTSEEIGVTNSIDQFYIEQGRRKYMFWGSFHGLYGIELSDDGLSVKKGAEKVRVAGDAYEAVYIHKRNGYYYMFASIGSCCEGPRSTYTLVVGRSRSLLGPYTDKKGGKMLDNAHEIVLQGNDRFKGPGHNAEIITDSAGADWLLYHAVDLENPGGRKLMLDRVDWVDGWPSVGDGTPSAMSMSPVF